MLYFCILVVQTPVDGIQTPTWILAADGADIQNAHASLSEIG